MTGNQAKAETTVESTIGDTKQTCSETVNLVLVGKDWLMHNPDGKMDRDSVINSFVMSCTEKDPPFNGDNKGTPIQVCNYRTKQIAIGILMLESDEDKLAFTPKDWVKKIDAYLINKNLLTCPLDKPGVTSYTVNPALCGKNLSKLKAASKIVLLYEGKNGKLSFKHEGKATVAFADGHVRQVTPKEAKGLRWKP
jgi:prepilin-type processing-associated H-X9-DG protein